MITRRQRIDYRISTMAVFITAFLIYGFIGRLANEQTNNSEIQAFFIFGALGGILISMLLGSVILAARFFSRKSRRFKIIASILWPVTFLCVFYGGFFSYLPYQVYNIVKIIKDKPKSET